MQNEVKKSQSNKSHRHHDKRCRGCARIRARRRRIPMYLFFLAFIASGCCVGGNDIVRYNDAGEVVQRWTGITHYEQEGSCISFSYGCEPTSSPVETQCGNVAVVPIGGQ